MPKPGELLARILDAPQIARVVPRLQPEVLHRIIQSCGLEDCGEIVALATPGQLARVFDLDLWRNDRPGLDEQFDAGRFGVWLELLMQSGDRVAARTVARMDAALVAGAIAQHVRVFDVATLAPPQTDDGETAATDPHGELDCDIGGYRVVAQRTDSWDAIVAVLAALDREHQIYFHRVMRACRRLSNAGFELDGLDDLADDREQAMFDLAVDREQRREKQGYVPPAQARAFLRMSRQPQPQPAAASASAPAGNPIAGAYFRALEWTTPDEAPAPEDLATAIAGVVDVLLEEGVLPQPPRALLGGAQGPAPKLARIQALMQYVAGHDPAAYAMRGQELAYLANTLVAGCSIQARPITADEASEAAVATCNLGLEHWPGTPAEDLLVGHDLVGVFQAGWAVLHRDVCMYAADALIKTLTRLRCEDREIQKGLNGLRIEMKKQWKAGTPWLAREAMDVLTMLDLPAWAALLGLIDECPVLHAGIAASARARTRSVSASAFEFISEDAQLASIRDFMQSLPDTLRA